VLQHHYLPPDEFLNAVKSGPRPGSDEYRQLLEQLSVDSRENLPVLEEPQAFRFVRTEHGIQREVVAPEEGKKR